MVKSKRDIITPRRRGSLTKKSTIVKVLSRPNSGVQATLIQPANANIRVVVRVRPANSREQDADCRNVVKVIDDQMLVFDPKEDAQAFFFHGVQQRGRDLLKKSHKHLQFMCSPNDKTNEEIFKESTYSLITSLMDGYNCSVFAYGATGAGKTYTMTGTPDTPGITFLTMTELFNKHQELSVERDFELGITYLEVYNELVKDLLNPGPPLQLREDGNTPDELFSLLEEGNKNRTQHPTDANAESSRSHAVFQVYIQMTFKGTGEVRTAKLSMIDLAGSERGSATGYVGARFTEGANINKSLLALGNCINSLADGQRHVPYRDSKLTRLLKDSLGGNCQTVMIANVSPSSMSYEDTYNTLKYATRAKKIKSNMKRNVVNVELHVSNYIKMVEELQKENISLKQQLAEKGCVADMQKAYDELKEQFDRICGSGSANVGDELLEKMNDLIQEKMEMMKRQFQLQKTEMQTNMRRKLKEETDARLSDFCVNTPEKREAHRKIGNVLDRCKKQENAIKGDIVRVEGLKEDIDEKLEDLVKEYPQLKTRNQREARRPDHPGPRRQVHPHGQNRALLKSCYVQLQGHGFVTASLRKHYQEILHECQGCKNVKWSESDSGVEATSTAALAKDDEPKRNLQKRKMEEPTADTMDTTFTMSVNLTPSKPKVKMCWGTTHGERWDWPPPPKRLGLSPRSPRNKGEQEPSEGPSEPSTALGRLRQEKNPFSNFVKHGFLAFYVFIMGLPLKKYCDLCHGFASRHAWQRWFA
ncbi:hypothetical protein NQ318_020581 [Aromia moschata]|uniref:Kinesin-like protein n=1 Tax=Aromia moschata TaxID=1265417 RepID=A0AAV8Z385_9CUCU|nr:hypothetical protein NQ318_020581 [Aromia moschata]